MGKAARNANRELRALKDDEIEPLDKGGIVIAWCYNQKFGVDGVFMESVLGSMLYDAQMHRGMNVHRGGYTSMSSSPRIAEARSQIVHEFLTNPVLAKAEWLWMVDTDMAWNESAYQLMLETIDRDKVPILGGMCYAGGHSKMVPTLYVLQNEDGEITSIEDVPENQLVKVDATGAAFLCVHRNVLVKMGAAFGQQANGAINPYPWFVESMTNKKGEPYGEDMAFCLRANHLGIPVHVHTGIEVDHMKGYALNTASYKTYREAQSLPGKQRSA